MQPAQRRPIWSAFTDMTLGFGFGFPRRWPGATVWTPAVIQTALWLDANDTSTITLNGSTVSQWNDKSGNGRNAVQATAANQPVYGTTNGRVGLAFDGADSLVCASNIQIVGGLTAFMVSAFRTTTFGFTRQFSQFDGPSANNRWMISPNDQIYNRFYVDAGGVVSSASIFTPSPVTWDTNPHILGGTYAPSQGVYAYFDGRSSDFSANNGTPAATNQNPLVIGASANIIINEVIAVASAVSNDDRRRIEGYLAWKWGGF